MVASNSAKHRMDRIIRLHEEIDQIKKDIRAIYAEEKAEGGDKTAMGEAITKIRKREKDKTAFDERENMVDVYLMAYSAPSRTHTHAREDRSDSGLNIQTKHEDIRTAPVTAEEQVPSSEQSEGNGSRDHQHVHSRQTDEAKHGGQDGEPAGADHASHLQETATQSLANGPCEAVSERTAIQVDASASAEAGVSGQPEMIPATSAESAGEAAGNAYGLPIISPETANETMGGTGDDCSFGNRGVWPPQGGASSSRGNDSLSVVTAGETATSSDQPGEGGADEVERSAPRAGNETHTSNTGEGAANTALPAKPKFVLRPYCRNPGETCGGSGTTHCHSCLKAREEVAA